MRICGAPMRERLQGKQPLTTVSTGAACRCASGALCVCVVGYLLTRFMDTGQIRRVDNDYKVVWPSGFELNERGQAAVMLPGSAQARDLRHIVGARY